MSLPPACEKRFLGCRKSLRVAIPRYLLEWHEPCFALLALRRCFPESCAT